MKNITELRQMSDKELQTELLNLRKEQFTLRMKKANGALDKTHVITLLRKTIARIKTLLTEKAETGHVK